MIELVGEIPEAQLRCGGTIPLVLETKPYESGKWTKSGEYHWSGYQWIKEDEPSRPFSLTEVYTKPTFWSIASSYLSVGFLHIVPKGLDHILFVLGYF